MALIQHPNPHKQAAQLRKAQLLADVASEMGVPAESTVSNPELRERLYSLAQAFDPGLRPASEEVWRLVHDLLRRREMVREAVLLAELL